MSFWKDFQEYIYRYQPGEEIRRADLTKEFPEMAKGRQGSTLDTYRRMMTVLGVLDDTGKPGVYTRGYVTLPPVYTKSYAEEKLKDFYVYVPNCLLDHANAQDWDQRDLHDWAFWERMVWQHFKPKSLLDEFYRGNKVDHDPNSLGFRAYRVMCWNAVAGTFGTCVNVLDKINWKFEKADELFHKAILEAFQK